MSERLLQAREMVVVDGTPALDLTIRHGDFVALIGPIGAPLGRLLRTLVGLKAPSSGEVRVFERPAEEWDWRLLRRSIGFATPAAPLLSTMSGLRNLMLPPLYHRLGSESEVLEHAKRLLAEIEVEGDPNNLPAYASELYRRHLILARALMLNPVILAVDEPLRGLGCFAAETMRRYLLGPVRQRVRAMLVAVDDPLLARHADQIVFVTERKVLRFDGWPALLACDDNELCDYLDLHRSACRSLEVLP